MNRQLEEALVEALDLLEQGTPVVKILSVYPELADELRPYLSTALDLNHLAKSSSTSDQEASKREFLQYAASMQVTPRKSAAVWLREILISGLAVLFILFFAGAVMAASSREAIPGDALYGTKLFLEQARLNYSANPEAAAALVEEMQQERLDEVNTLLSLGRQEMVTFSGEVEELAEGRWVVAGIPVAVTSSTIIHDEVEVGFLVQVMGKTSSNVVLAEQVEVMAGRPSDDDLPDPLPLESPTPLPTIEPLQIPQRPDLLLPDSGPQTSPPAPAPAPTTITGDDSTADDGAGHEDESDAQDSQEREDENDQQELEAGSDESSHDGNDESDERQEDGGQSQGSGEESDDDKGDEVKKDSGDEDDKRREEDSNEKDGEEKGKNDPDKKD